MADSDSSLDLSSSDDEINSAAVGAMTIDRNAKKNAPKKKDSKDKTKKAPTEVQFRINKYDDTAKILRFPTGKHTPVSAVVKAMCETLGLQANSFPLFALWLEGDHLRTSPAGFSPPVLCVPFQASRISFAVVCDNPVLYIFVASTSPTLPRLMEYRTANEVPP